MPEISRFFGMIVRMFLDDHPPPHFHVVYGESEAHIGIKPIKVLKGKLPNRAISMIIEWTALHQEELMLNWDRLHKEQLPEKIEPLK